MTAVQNSVLVAPSAAFAGMLADNSSSDDIITLYNGEVSASIAFGWCVAFKTTTPVADKTAILPTAATGLVVAGIVVHKANYSRTFTLPDGTVAGDLDSVGLVVGTTMAVLRRGRIWVQPRQAVAVGDRLFVCDSANVTYTAKGQVGNADESANTIDCTRLGTYLTSCAALGFAILDVDFTSRNS